MLDLTADVQKVKHRGKPLDIGITKHKRGLQMIIEIDQVKASFKGKKWSGMTTKERDDLEDLLYLTNIHEADVRFLYV